MPIQTYLHEGFFTQEQEKTYVHLPFEMPVGASRLDVEYQYSDRISSEPGLEGGNTIDLGVFDEGGIDFLTAGFRGWSGSERPTFFIAEEEAAPGYLAGRLNPGKWHVLLGLYKIGPQGCSYKVSIRIATREEHQRGMRSVPAENLLVSRGALQASRGGLPTSTPPAAFSPWLRGELHCHTWHSDGQLSAAELVKLSVERGLDFLAVTDHNTIASQQELEKFAHPGLVLIRGVEVTSFKGHFNVWGVPDWVDFRISQPEEMQAALEFATQRGALVSCNHPKPYGPAWDFPEVTNFHCVEVWNGPWFLFNQLALDYWLSLLQAGRRIPAVAGSDFHRLDEMTQVISRAPGSPVNWVHVTGKPDAPSILKSISAGHASLSDSPEGPFLDLRAGEKMVVLAGDLLPVPIAGKLSLQVHCLRGAGCSLRILDQQKVLFEKQIAENEEHIAVDLPAADSLFVRAELRTDEDQLRAMTNPIYLPQP